MGSSRWKVAGGAGVKASARCAGRKPGEGEAQEGRGSNRGLTNLGWHRTHRGEQGPEGEGAKAGAGHTAGRCVQRQEGMTRPAKAGTAPWRGTNPCRANPGRGSGVKQTRKAGGGGNRRRREKRRGRNLTVGWDPTEWWTPPADVAMRKRNPMGGALWRRGVVRFSGVRRAVRKPLLS